jgi:hypothetical protein
LKRLSRPAISATTISTAHDRTVLDFLTLTSAAARRQGIQVVEDLPGGTEGSLSRRESALNDGIH